MKEFFGAIFALIKLLSNFIFFILSIGLWIFVIYTIYCMFSQGYSMNEDDFIAYLKIIFFGSIIAGISWKINCKIADSWKNK